VVNSCNHFRTTSVFCKEPSADDSGREVPLKAFLGPLESQTFHTLCASPCKVMSDGAWDGTGWANKSDWVLIAVGLVLLVAGGGAGCVACWVLGSGRRWTNTTHVPAKDENEGAYEHDREFGDLLVEEDDPTESLP
jgi:hypothetical protein